MTFDQYVSLIARSVAEAGYDNFLPSLCVLTDAMEMEVLQTELSADGEESVAKQWASDFTEPGRTLFLAYQQGSRMVMVLEITGTEVTNKQRIAVTAKT